jgi:hypothetical protein
MWRHSHLRWSNRLYRHYLRRSDAMWRHSYLRTDLRADLWPCGSHVWADYLRGTNSMRRNPYVRGPAYDLRTADYVWRRHGLRWHSDLRTDVRTDLWAGNALRRSSHLRTDLRADLWPCGSHVWADYLRGTNSMRRNPYVRGPAYDLRTADHVWRRHGLRWHSDLRTDVRTDLRAGNALRRSSHLRTNLRADLRSRNALRRSSHLRTDLRADLWSRDALRRSSHLRANYLRRCDALRRHSAAYDLRTFDHVWWRHGLRRH